MSSVLFPYLVHLDVYSHGFRVSQFTDSVYRLCVSYCMRYVERSFVGTGRGRFQQQITKVYAAATRQRDAYFFHRHSLDDFIQHLKDNHIPEDRIKITHHEMYEPVFVDFDWQETSREPRPIQLQIVEFFAKLFPRIKVLTMQMGGGKTFSTLLAIYKLRARTVLILRAMYMDQWTKDAVKTLGLKKGEIYTVNGAKAMQALIEMAKDEEMFAKVKLVIISNATYRMFLRSYLDEPHKDLGYGCKPWEFFALTRSALRVVDEVHLDFHLNFIIDCLSHVYKSVSLSATLESDDHFKNSLYKLMFPEETHAPKPEYDRYIDLYSVAYRIRDNNRIRFLNMFRQYSQTAYEKSIMRYKPIWKNYVDMIVRITDYQFLRHRDYQPGMKCAIFCGMVEMCEAVAEALKVRFPTLKVRRFVSEDPDEHLIEGDLIVTTLQSCGTGKDIPDLAACISSIALSNKQSNEQLIGRLRRLKRFPDVTPRFIFLYNSENPKHAQYQAARKHKLEGKMRNFNELTSDLVI